MKLIRFFAPRIEYILFAAIFWGTIASGPRILNFDGDLPRHLLVGDLILQTRHVSLVDDFSFRTVGYPSIPHEWLAQVIFAGAKNIFGLNGVVLLTGIILTLTWGMVYYDTARRSKDFFITLVILALAIGAGQLHVLPRPHLFTYLLTAVWVILIERIDESNTRAWGWLPLVMLVWVNLHGMFVIGIIIWGIYLTGDFLDHPSKIWLASAKAKALITGGIFALAATLFSPSGARIWEAIASLGSNAYITSKIPEYQSANFHLPETWPFILILSLTLIGFARAADKLPWAHILMVVAFAGVALYSSRMIPLFAIASAPITAKALADWIRKEYPESRLSVIERNVARINASSNGFIWIPIVVIMVALLLQSGKAIDPENRGNIFDNRFFPVEAATWLQMHPQQGHMFNEFDWGGYLLLRLWPDQQVFMDGHTHIYGETLTREYEQVISLGKGWENILAKYHVEWVIMHSNAPLINALVSSENWAIAYQDQTAVILIRR